MSRYNVLTKKDMCQPSPWMLRSSTWWTWWGQIFSPYLSYRRCSKLQKYNYDAMTMSEEGWRECAIFP